MSFKPERYLLLYLPWILSLMFSANPVISYSLAWFGSFFIFYISMKGLIRPIPSDLSIGEQAMRPLFLMQIIFAGYMCCTSIFYFFNVLGYVDFIAPAPNYPIDFVELALVVDCQQYYCLGHAAMVTGVLACMNYPITNKYYLTKTDLPNFLLVTSLIALPLSIFFLKAPGLRQFYAQFSSLSFVSGTLAFAFSIPAKKQKSIIICAFLYASNFSAALLSGYKEPIIVSVLILGVFLYPFYKRTVLLIFIPALLILFTLLPTYNRIFREKAWSGAENSEDASEAALDAVLNQTGDGSDVSNWEFLTTRLSEMSMFTRYVSSTPDFIPYYGLTIVKQSLIAIIPRIFWPGKPDTESLVMERVYDAGVIDRRSYISAKPAVVVDAYLSGGTVGVFLTFLLYGAAAQFISLKAEKLFGSYLIGTALIFSGLFQIFWRGATFEFMINSVIWSYISMFVIFKAFRSLKILQQY